MKKTINKTKKTINKTQSFVTFFLLFIFVFSTFVIPVVSAQQAMSSSNYKIQSDSVNFGGGRTSSTNYNNESTFGEIGTGDLSSTSYTTHAGYQGMQIDIIRPTAPPSIQATALSTDKIEIVWGASTDDYGVVSYNIYRDGVLIDNVSYFPRDYVDTGLRDLTTYAYNVAAVDLAGNISEWSATSSAKTFPFPPPGNIPSKLYDLNIIPTDSVALVTFKTTQESSVKIFYGKTTSYELGNVSDKNLLLNHALLIKSLSPNTLYHLKIELTDQYGKNYVYENISFRTMFGPYNNSKQTAITDFVAVPKEKSVELSWKNPTDPSVVGVRIVRSTDFFVRDPSEGKIIYEGNASDFSDKDVKPGTTYYYTIFAKDFVDNFSSGSVASARVPLPGETPVVISNPFENLPKALDVDPKIASLTLKQFDFIQHGEKLLVVDDRVKILNKENLTIALRYDKVPEILKTIAVTLIDTETNKTFTFLLRVDTNKNNYMATLAPLEKTGIYQIKITVVDYKNQGMKFINGFLDVVDKIISPITNTKPGSKIDFNTLLSFIAFGLLVALAVILKRWLEAFEADAKIEDEFPEDEYGPPEG